MIATESSLHRINCQTHKVFGLPTTPLSPILERSSILAVMAIKGDEHMSGAEWFELSLIAGGNSLTGFVRQQAVSMLNEISSGVELSPNTWATVSGVV